MKKGQILCIIEAMKLMNEIEVSIDFVLHLNFLLLCSAAAIIAICLFVFFIFYFLFRLLCFSKQCFLKLLFSCCMFELVIIHA